MAKARRLTSDEFSKVIHAVRFTDRTQEIAYGVLVLGKRQVHFVNELGMTKGAVNQAVNRVWEAAQRLSDISDSGPIPPGFERVTAILPEAQAYQVKQWKKEADARRLRLVQESKEARRPNKGTNKT